MSGESATCSGFNDCCYAEAAEILALVAAEGALGSRFSGRPYACIEACDRWGPDDLVAVRHITAADVSTSTTYADLKRQSSEFASFCRACAPK